MPATAVITHCGRRAPGATSGRAGTRDRGSVDHRCTPACEAATTGGFDDWRLPDRNELATLVDLEQSNPALTSGIFNGIVSTALHTSTHYMVDLSTDYEWRVHANQTGSMEVAFKSDSLQYLCVRAAD